MVTNNLGFRNVLLNSFHLNGHTLRFLSILKSYKRTYNTWEKVILTCVRKHSQVRIYCQNRGWQLRSSSRRSLSTSPTFLYQGNLFRLQPCCERRASLSPCLQQPVDALGSVLSEGLHGRWRPAPGRALIFNLQSWYSKNRYDYTMRNNYRIIKNSHTM